MINMPAPKKIAAYACLTIGVLMLGSVFLSLSGVDGDYEKLFSIVGNIGSVLIGAGMFFLGWQQNLQLKQQQRRQQFELSEKEKDRIRENYHRLIEGISKIYNNYGMFGAKADGDDILKRQETRYGVEILRAVTHQARLELPDELVKYTQKVHETAEAILLASQWNEEKLKEYTEVFDNISTFFNASETYSKFLKKTNRCGCVDSLGAQRFNLNLNLSTAQIY
jgi:hypothetical protein